MFLWFISIILCTWYVLFICFYYFSFFLHLDYQSCTPYICWILYSPTSLASIPIHIFKPDIFFLSTRHYITCCTWVWIVTEHTLYITCHFFISNWAICLWKYSRMMIHLFICSCSVWAFTFEEKKKCLFCTCQLHWVVDKKDPWNPLDVLVVVTSLMFHNGSFGF